MFGERYHLHVLLPVTADEDEGVGQGGGGGHDHDVPQEVGGRHLGSYNNFILSSLNTMIHSALNLYEYVIHPFSRFSQFPPILLPVLSVSSPYNLYIS